MKVDTLIIGAGRSGTTTLCKFLEQHNQVCFSKIKEVHYFSIDELNKRGEEYYHSFFSHFENDKIVASADTYLLMDYDAIARVKAYNPDMRIIVMLRNPVDRAYSSYNYSVNYGYHQAYNSFLTSIEKEQNITDERNIVQRNNLGHFYGSLYNKHLIEWENTFPKKNFLILTTNQLKNNSSGIKQQLSEFLSINTFDKQGTNNSEKHNTNAVPKFRAFEQFLLNRDNPIRKFIRWVVPSFLKRIIIHSNVVDKIHDINRKASDYAPLDVESQQKAFQYFEEDLNELKINFNIEF